jgi:hypothetical protein
MKVIKFNMNFPIFRAIAKFSKESHQYLRLFFCILRWTVTASKVTLTLYCKDVEKTSSITL